VEAAQNSVKAIQQQMRQDQRAWVSFSGSGSVRWPKNEAGLTGVSEELGYINTGKTAAKKLIVKTLKEDPKRIRSVANVLADATSSESLDNEPAMLTLRDLVDRPLSWQINRGFGFWSGSLRFFFPRRLRRRARLNHPLWGFCQGFRGAFRFDPFASSRFAAEETSLHYAMWAT